MAARKPTNTAETAADLEFAIELVGFLLPRAAHTLELVFAVLFAPLIAIHGRTAAVAAALVVGFYEIALGQECK